MDVILQKFAGKIDAQSLVKTVEDLKIEYIDDWSHQGGHSSHPQSSYVGNYQVQETLPVPRRKKLVIGILNYLIEQIDEGEKGFRV